MSHEVETMAWSGHAPWHGLGVEVDSNLSAAEMQKAAGLDWSVERVKMHAFWKGKPVQDVDREVLVRSTDGAVLTYITPEWHPVQNDEAFAFFHDAVEAGGMKMNTAGSLRNGKRVWALAEMDSKISPIRGDTIKSYMLFCNPHEYGQSITIMHTPTRVVCMNTLTLALGSDRSTAELKFKINHRRKFDLERVKEAVKIANVKLTKYGETAKFLASKKATQADTVEYFQKLFPSSAAVVEDGKLSRSAKRLLAVVDTQPGAKFGEGSWWQVFNACTFGCNHILTKDPASRLESMWYGGLRTKSHEGLELALEYAEKADAA